MKKNNIWLLVDSSKAGGIESHIFQLAQGLQEKQQRPLVVFVTDYGPHPLKTLLTEQGLTYKTLDGRFTTLHRALRQARPAIIHTHGYKAGIWGRLCGKLNRIPIVSTYHAGEISSGKLAFYDKIDRLTALFADHVFAVSPQIAKRLPSQAQVFDNFVNTKQTPDSKGKQIAFVGRVSEEKGPDHFAYLAKQLPDHDFHLYGEGPLLAGLRANHPKNLHLHGQQNNMQDVWSNIGLLVIPSRYEGLPMAALEAMARGIPVLAFRVGALDKLIDNNINGWLIEPEDTKQLVNQLTQWATLPKEKKRAMQGAAKQTILDKFSSDIAIPKLIDRYQELLIR